jgi:hypothetical protein
MSRARVRGVSLQILRPCLLSAVLRKCETYVTPGMSAAKDGFIAKKLVFVLLLG